MKFLALVLTAIIFSNHANAETIDCFIVKEGEKFLTKEGKNCDVQYSPASTFKLPLAVIGFESGILKDENHPIWQAKEPPTFLRDYWSGDKTPATWMRYSIVWYSQMLTTKLGEKNFQKYVDRLNYGNRDLSGGLTAAWLSSSLKISPNEQIIFIDALAKNELPFSKNSQMQVKNLARLFEESMLSDGWDIYGKTGTDVDFVSGERRGYFVGFSIKNDRLIDFVIHISGEKNSPISGIYAKKIAMNKLLNGALKK